MKETRFAERNKKDVVDHSSMRVSEVMKRLGKSTYFVVADKASSISFERIISI